METMELPRGVKVIETGIAGMSLVQELQDGWDALVVLDAVDLGRPPGQVMKILPDVIDVHALTLEERMDLLALGHYGRADPCAGRLAAERLSGGRAALVVVVRGWIGTLS